MKWPGRKPPQRREEKRQLDRVDCSSEDLERTNRTMSSRQRPTRVYWCACDFDNVNRVLTVGGHVLTLRQRLLIVDSRRVIMSTVAWADAVYIDRPRGAARQAGNITLGAGERSASALASAVCGNRQRIDRAAYELKSATFRLAVCQAGA